MKQQVKSIFAAMVLCLGIGGFVCQTDGALADDEVLLTMPDYDNTAELSSTSVTSSLYSYNEIDMPTNTITLSYSNLQEIASSGSEGLRLTGNNGAIIMDKNYLTSLLSQTGENITFALSITGNSVAVSAKASDAPIYGDEGICIIEAQYSGGNIYTSIENATGNKVGNSCYYSDGSVMRWQLEDCETYTFVNDQVSFSDTAKHWSNEYVTFLGSRDVVNGVGANKYEPNANLTRGQFITILARVSPDAVSDYTTESFADVKEGDYFYNPVCWGIANEIVNGRSAGKFEPNAKITREEMATMCWRFANYLKLELKPVRTPGVFVDDAAIQSYAKEAVQQSYNAGYINGKGKNEFVPQGNATRGEAATMIAGLISYITALPH